MKVAIIGSRGYSLEDLGSFLPEGVTELVSGGEKSIDTSVKEYADKNGIKLTEFLAEYEKYGKSAPLRRYMEIINYADLVIAFWDGKSLVTEFVIDQCRQRNVPLKSFLITPLSENIYH